MIKNNFLLIILSQIFIVFFLSYKIYSQRKNILGVAINPISKNSIDLKQNGELKYFYEPKASSTSLANEVWLKHEIKNTINNDTLNERFDYLVKKPVNTYRIVTLGDSFTFGRGVSTKDNYSEQLEELLNNKCSKKYEVINLGVSGYDVEYMRERYMVRGKKYSPDLVVMLFGSFQLTRLNEESAIRIEKMKKKDPKLEDQLAYMNTTQDIISDYGWESILKWQELQLNQLMELIKPNKLIVEFPFNCAGEKKISYKQTLSQFFPCTPFIDYNNLFREVNNKRKDIYLQTISNYNDAKFSLADGHPNQEGHKAIAEDLFKYLTKNNLIPCK